MIRKVMFLVCVGDYSGAENMSLLVADQLRYRGYDVAYCSPEGKIENYIRENYKEIRYISLKSFKIKEIKKAVYEFQPDIMYAVDFKVSMIVSILNIRYVTHLHNNPNWIRKRSIFTLVLLHALNHSVANICVSDSIMREFIFSNKVKRKTKTLLNVVDADKVIKLAQETENKKYEIGFLGRLAEQKNPIRFLSFINMLKYKLKYNPCAVMVGADGGLLSKCESEILKYKLNVDYVGFQKNPYKYIKQCKIILMPSRWEGFGLTAVESMILGIPVLASPVGGLPTVIGMKENLCESDEQFIDRATVLLTDEDIYRDTSNKVMRQAALFTNIEKYTDKIEEMFGE